MGWYLDKFNQYKFSSEAAVENLLKDFLAPGVIVDYDYAEDKITLRLGERTLEIESGGFEPNLTISEVQRHPIK